MAVRPLGTPDVAAMLLADSHADRMDEAEVLERAPNPTAPTSLRLSVPLLRTLDRMAAAQHRTRSNLIQHILWQHVLGRREAEA